MPGARKPGGPLSCEGRLVREAQARSLQPLPSVASHLQQDRNYSTEGWGPPVQAPPSVPGPASSREKGPEVDRRVGGKRGSGGLLCWGSPWAQRHLAQFSTLWDPSEDPDGRSEAEGLQGFLWSPALSPLPVAGSGDLDRGEEENRDGRETWRQGEKHEQL